MPRRHAVVRIQETRPVRSSGARGVRNEAGPQVRRREGPRPRQHQGGDTRDMGRRHRGALGPRIFRRARREIPDRGHDTVGRVSEGEVPARRPDADVGAVVGVRRRLPVRADRGHGQDARVRRRVVGRGRAAVSRRGHDERSRLRGAEDCPLQRRIALRAAKTQVDDPRAHWRLDGAARSVVRGQPRGVQDPLGDVIARAEAADAQHSNRTDPHRPVHAGHADAVVAHSADRAGDVQAMVAERIGNEAGPRGVERIGRGYRRIGVVAVSVIRVADLAAGAQGQRVHAIDEVVPIAREVPADRRMVEADAVVHHGHEHAGTPRGDRPCPRQIDEAIMPGLEGVQRIVGRRGTRPAGAGGHPAVEWRLIQPDELIGDDAGDPGVLA